MQRREFAIEMTYTPAVKYTEIDRFQATPGEAIDKALEWRKRCPGNWIRCVSMDPTTVWSTWTLIPVPPTKEQAFANLRRSLEKAASGIFDVR